MRATGTCSDGPVLYSPLPLWFFRDSRGTGLMDDDLLRRYAAVKDRLEGLRSYL